MQQFDDRFYCVSCGQLMEMKNAEILFRTGYFRVVHPLGCCLACEMKQSHADMLPDHHRLHSGSNPATVDAMLAGLASGVSGAASDSPGLAASWYRQTEDERSLAVHMNLL